MDKCLMRSFGDTEKTISQYEIDSLEKRAKTPNKGLRIRESYIAEISGIELLDEFNVEKSIYGISEPLKIRVHINAFNYLEEPIVQIAIFNEKIECMLSQMSKTDGYDFKPIKGKAYVDFFIKEIPFNQGIYKLSVKLMDQDFINTIDYHKEYYTLKIITNGKIGFEGRNYLSAEWILVNEHTPKFKQGL